MITHQAIMQQRQLVIQYQLTMQVIAQQATLHLVILTSVFDILSL